MMLNFVYQFILHPGVTGAIAPTGRKLSRHIVELAELESARSIVELGPGTGVFTREIIQKKSPDSLFFTIEKNPSFVEKMRATFPTIHTYEDSASTIPAHLNAHAATSCDRIVSGLPWAIFDHNEQQQILETIYSSLEPGGIFVTFSYIHSRMLFSGQQFRSLLCTRFQSVTESDIVWRNLPPAFVYTCRK